IRKTVALVLRITPFSNTSHVVAWLTDAGENISTMIKGARRPKSAFLGQYDLFYTCELLYYRRETGGLHIAREASPLQTRPELRRNWRSFGGASYICQLILSTVMEGQAGHVGYGLAESALAMLDSGGPRVETMLWFELQWLGHLGFAPQLQYCAKCRL